MATICEAASSRRGTGTGLNTQLCYDWIVEDTEDQFEANSLAIAITPTPPVTYNGILLDARQLVDSGPIGSRGDCWFIRVCLINKGNNEYQCDPGDFSVTFDATTVTEKAFASLGSTCVFAKPNGQVETIDYSSLPTGGYEYPRPVFRKSLRACFENGFVTQAWEREVEEMVGTTNSVSIGSHQADEMLLTAVRGGASGTQPYIFEFSWDVIREVQVPYSIGKPESDPAGEGDDKYCSITWNNPTNITKPGWANLRVIRKPFIPCEGTDQADNPTEYIESVCIDRIVPQKDHKTILPPAFQNFSVQQFNSMIITQEVR